LLCFDNWRCSPLEPNFIAIFQVSFTDELVMCAVPFKFDTPSPDEKNIAARGLKKPPSSEYCCHLPPSS
jgi:hypothetical protein